MEEIGRGGGGTGHAYHSTMEDPTQRLISKWER